MEDLVYEAKWTVLDLDNAEPEEAAAAIEKISKLSEPEAIECLKSGLQVEINGDMKPASECDIYIGSVLVANDRIEVKSLELKLASELDADKYSEEYGEAMYMEWKFDDYSVPFMAWESFGIS